MSDDDLRQLELLSSLDRLRERVAAWSSTKLHWDPALRCQSLMNRVLSRVETLQIRYEAPLVVATFGGTGTGKSTLVNALVGEEVSRTGRERPTTREPTLIVHTETDLDVLNLPLEDVEVVRRNAEVLRDIIVLDCPDPDTNEADEAGSNLARLRKLLPFCDVLLVVSTQQKYRSARVAEELQQAASGCRMIFVQTHADLDEDIRSDWRNTLADAYEVPDVFFVDSPRAFAERARGEHPTGEFGRLIDLLTTKLGASERVRIRRVNVLDLLQSGLTRCQEIVSARRQDLQVLQQALSAQREQLSRRMASHLKRELLTSHGLWERRLLASVTDHWGVSPFSVCLRIYNGLGSVLASLTFFRVRSTAQLALLGTVQGKRWLNNLRQEQQTEETLERVSRFGLDESHLREAEIVVRGHALETGFDASLLQNHGMESLRREAAAMESQFVIDAGQRIDESIDALAMKNSKLWIRSWYELLFLSYLLFVLYRVGNNFFYESFFHDAPLLEGNFYLAAGLFFLLWSAGLVIAFTRRLRRGVRKEVQKLISEMVENQLQSGLFPQLENALVSTERWSEELDRLLIEVTSLRNEVAVTSVLGEKTPQTKHLAAD